MASILVIQGPDKGRSIDLTDGENVIGRQGSSIPLTDGTISRNHARLSTRSGKWVLEDLGSANGTYLNGVKVSKPQPVIPGDQIRCGKTLLVLGGGIGGPQSAVDVDEDGQLVDAAIVATIPSNEDSVIIPTPEAGIQAIGNLRILYDLIGETSSIFNIDLLLHRTLDRILDVVKADRGFIMLVDEKGHLTLKASRIPKGSTGPNVPISRTIINEVITRQVGALSSNAMADKRFAAGKSVHDFGIRSAICVPIKGRERVLGVIHIDCSMSELTYSTEQLRLLTAIGYQTGLALENARLYESAVQTERLAAVGETVAVLSHHIKNILQALGSGIEVVGMGLKNNDLPKAKAAWPIVDRNLDRINSLILNMLAYSTKREPLAESINVNAVLQDCLDLVAPRADERGVAVMSDLDDMPPIPADVSGLQQAFMNLLTNALDAVPDKTGVVTIASKYDSMNRNVLVTVSDNGRGIAPGQMDQLFTPFYTSKGQRGTGLGLAVTQKIVKEHHGRVDVKSKVGQGTTFTIVLPAMGGIDSSDTDHPNKLTF